MTLFIDLMNSIREFLDTGGQVLTVIAGVICLMWLLIFERLFFYLKTNRSIRNNIITSWNNRDERNSWNAEHIRMANVLLLVSIYRSQALF